MNLKNFIKDVADYPKPGINFKDITPLLNDKNAFKYAVDSLAEKFRGKNIDAVLGIDARGFLLAAPVAYYLGTGLAIVRKSGKLPRKTISENYDLEYGKNVLEIHEDAISNGQNILIIDDILATGGTMEAACRMIEKLGGNITGIGCLIELEFLNGREKLKKYNIDSLLKY